MSRPHDAQSSRLYLEDFEAMRASADRLKVLNAELVEALEFVEGLYSHEARAAENSMALYEACCMARAALAKHKEESP